MELTADNLNILVERFYAKVLQDALIGPKFEHLDMQAHLPIMVEFWSMAIFGQGNYSGSPFDKHIPLGLKAEHFDRWMLLFEQTAKENFNGPAAEDIVKRAATIGQIFQHKLKGLERLDE